MLITDVRDLRRLAQGAPDLPGCRWMRGVDAKTREIYLSAPAALARCIASERTDLLALASISVGVEAVLFETADNGAWWSALAALLGKEPDWARVDVTVRDDTDLDRTSHGAPSAATKNITCIDGDCIAASKWREPKWDIVFVAIAEPTAVAGLFVYDDHNLRNLVSAARPTNIVVGLNERRFVRLFEGCAVALGFPHGAIENPLSLRMDGEGNLMSHVAWAVADRSPGNWDRVAEDVDRVQDIEEVVESLANNSGEVSAVLEAVEEPFRDWGSVGLLKSSLDATDFFVQLPRSYVLRKRDNRIFRCVDDLHIGEPLQLDPRSATVDDFAGENWIGRAWWAAQVWERVLKPVTEGTLRSALESARGGFVSPTDIRRVVEGAAIRGGLSADRSELMASAVAGCAPKMIGVEARRLFDAVLNSRWSEVVQMVREQPELRDATNQTGEPLLLALSDARSESTFIEILRLGADPNIVDAEMRPLIVNVAGNGQTAATIALLQAGADVNAHDYFGWTALNLALMRGFWELAGVLLNAGAVVTAESGSCGFSARAMARGVGADASSSFRQCAADLANKIGFDLSAALKQNRKVVEPVEMLSWLRERILQCTN